MPTDVVLPNIDLFRSEFKQFKLGRIRCKLKLGPKLPTKKGFGLKNFFGTGPDAVKVGPLDNRGILKSGFFSI